MHTRHPATLSALIPTSTESIRGSAYLTPVTHPAEGEISSPRKTWIESVWQSHLSWGFAP